MKKLGLKTLVVFFTLAASCTLLAHNKVVVIPLAGDDAELEPFALIPADNANPASYTSANGITLDMITGLEWQQVDSGLTYSFDLADDHCAVLTLNSKTDWRLPTAKELLSIVDFGTFSPAIDGSAFPATGSVSYWTATDIRTNNNFRWTIDFDSGRHSNQSEATSSSVRARCVRSNGKNALVQVFNDNGNGTVTDLASGLIWQQQEDSNTYTHVAALSYCQNLVFAGSSNWRLPEVKELASLLDYRASFPVIDSQLFPIPGVVFDYWAAPITAGNLSNSWGVGYGTGDVFTTTSAYATFARCVR